jgi:hypothetical protein
VAARRNYSYVLPDSIRTAMNWRLPIAYVFAILLCTALAYGCSTAQNPAPAMAPPPAVVPVVAASPSKPDPLMQEWNIFPDPTTGKVEVYHKGAYVGAVTGNEPPDQDPPVPHQTNE